MLPTINAIISAAAPAMSRMRKTFAGGCPTVVRLCEGCGEDFAALAMRADFPQCPVARAAGRPGYAPKTTAKKARA